MNILYLLKHAPDQTIGTILDNQKSEHAVTVVDLREDKDYDRIVDLIVSSDRIMSW